MRKKEKHLKKNIINAALKIFAKKGFYETTVDDIAKAVGIAKGTVYLYFKDKPTLYISTIDEHLVDGTKFLLEIENQNISSTEKLQKIASNWFQIMAQMKTSFPMFTFENINLTRRLLKGLKPIIILRLTGMIKIIAKIIDSGIKNNEFRKIQPKIAAVHFLNTIRTGIFADFFTPGTSVSYNTAMKLFFVGLKKRR